MVTLLLCGKNGDYKVTYINTLTGCQRIVYSAKKKNPIVHLFKNKLQANQNKEWIQVYQSQFTAQSAVDRMNIAFFQAWMQEAIDEYEVQNPIQESVDKNQNLATF